MDKTTIVIVGVGALGSHLVPLLRNEKVAIKIVDFDRIEQKNVASQFHAKTTVGKAKVVGLAQTLQFLFGQKVEGIPHRVTVDNVKQILGGAHLVIDCLDNGASRRLIQDAVRATNTPCLHGALAADGGFGRIVWDEHFQIDDESAVGAPTCEGGEHLPFVALASAYLARSAQTFLRQQKKVGYQVSPAGAMAI